MRIQKMSSKGREFLTREEGGHYLKAYRCQANIPTISVGCTYYEDGTRVKMGDSITLERSEKLFQNVLSGFEQHVDNVTRDDINQNQFDALVSLCFNIGMDAFRKSTLLALVNVNPNNPDIAKQFAAWRSANGAVSKGLVNRRKRESALYFLPSA
jgi:lysozyme